MIKINFIIKEEKNELEEIVATMPVDNIKNAERTKISNLQSAILKSLDILSNKYHTHNDALSEDLRQCRKEVESGAVYSGTMIQLQGLLKSQGLTKIQKEEIKNVYRCLEVYELRI